MRKLKKTKTTSSIRKKKNKNAKINRNWLINHKFQCGITERLEADEECFRTRRTSKWGKWTTIRITSRYTAGWSGIFCASTALPRSSPSQSGLYESPPHRGNISPSCCVLCWTRDETKNRVTSKRTSGNERDENKNLRQKRVAMHRHKIILERKNKPKTSLESLLAAADASGGVAKDARKMLIVWFTASHAWCRLHDFALSPLRVTARSQDEVSENLWLYVKWLGSGKQTAERRRKEEQACLVIRRLQNVFLANRRLKRGGETVELAGDGWLTPFAHRELAEGRQVKTGKRISGGWPSLLERFQRYRILAKQK